MLLTAPELPELSFQYRQAAEKEAAVEIKRRLADHALALAQFAEKIDRGYLLVIESSAERYQRMFTRALDPTRRMPIENLLREEEAKLEGQN